MTILSKTMDWGDMLIYSLMGILIVLTIISVLVFAFTMTGKISIRNSQRRMQKQVEKSGQAVSSNLLSDISASEIAAISMALYLFSEDTHDQESNVITIKRIERRYSPWNSKIYGLTNLNR